MIDANQRREKWASLVNACLRGGLAIRYRTHAECMPGSDQWNELRIDAVFRNWSRARAARSKLH